jgi:hypothetical protein
VVELGSRCSAEPSRNDQRPPPRQHRPQFAPDGRHRQQHDRGQRRPREYQHRRGELADRDLDQQVGDAPGHAEQNEQDQAAPRHTTIVQHADPTRPARLFS